MMYVRNNRQCTNCLALNEERGWWHWRNQHVSIRCPGIRIEVNHEMSQYNRLLNRDLNRAPAECK